MDWTEKFQSIVLIDIVDKPNQTEQNLNFKNNKCKEVRVKW